MKEATPIAVHHGGNTDTAHDRKCCAVLCLHGGNQRRIGGLPTLPDFFQGVCPDAVLQAVFSSKLALRKGSARCIDQNCLNTGGAKLHAEGTGFQVNLHEGSPLYLYSIPDASLPNTRIYKMPHSGIDPECGTQRIS